MGRKVVGVSSKVWCDGGKYSYCHSKDALTKDGVGTSRWEA